MCHKLSLITQNWRKNYSESIFADDQAGLVNTPSAAQQDTNLGAYFCFLFTIDQGSEFYDPEIIVHLKQTLKGN